MQNARAKFQQQGIGLAAISYDSEAILRQFTQRHQIDYPLIADADSAIIRSYGVLNSEATGSTKGMAYPGYFYVAPNKTIKEKFFETAYANRYTANNVIVKLFPELVEGKGREVAAPNIKLTLFQSDESVGPGSRFTVATEIALPPDTHVYSPEVKGYKPIRLALDESPDYRLLPVHYPTAKTLFLPVINESVPVYEGDFRLLQDVVISSDRQFLSSLTQAKAITLSGTLFYQACDHEKCYLPQKTAVSWKVQVLPLDKARAPEAIRHPE